jgi:hypothetical protein
MKGLELLVVGEAIAVQTAYKLYPRLRFLRFEQENDDVTLAAFSCPNTLDTLYFDISIPSNQVKKV